ncbi:MAG: endolytic transglycosylase MltG [Atopobiaceae bacterium]|nr:endolytic transglycosylase MltG [Atopobiaceae bacterium]
MSAPSPRTDPAPSQRVDSVTQGVQTRRISERSQNIRSNRSSRKGGSPIASIIAALLIVGALAAAAYFFILPMFFSASEGPTESVAVTVTIPDGAGCSQIAQILAEAEVIDDVSSFMNDAQRSHKDSLLKPGTYSFYTHSSNSTVLDQLVSGPNTSADRITIPEGYTVGQTAALLDGSFGIDSETFIQAAHASAYVEDYPFLAEANEDSLEGFLYGKTYDFSGREQTADAAIRAMLSQYQAEVASIDMGNAINALNERYGLDLSTYDILRMASIIEREAVTAEDRPLVSSVFYNRLAAGMRLQSDATMMYVTGGEVTAADLEQDSPYNTYLHDGFPPTPICSPSIECIQAALAPAETDYYFFYIVEDGSTSIHAFSETYEEHLAVIDSARG